MIDVAQIERALKDADRTIPSRQAASARKQPRIPKISLGPPRPMFRKATP